MCLKTYLYANQVFCLGHFWYVCQKSVQLNLKSKYSGRNASRPDGVPRACAAMTSSCVGFETEPGFEV